MRRAAPCLLLALLTRAAPRQAGVKDKKIDFVEVIKADLRKNNDDYVEPQPLLAAAQPPPPAWQIPPEPPSSSGSPGPPPQDHKHPDKVESKVKPPSLLRRALKPNRLTEDVLLDETDLDRGDPPPATSKRVLAKNSKHSNSRVDHALARRKSTTKAVKRKFSERLTNKPETEVEDDSAAPETTIQPKRSKASSNKPDLEQKTDKIKKLKLFMEKKKGLFQEFVKQKKEAPAMRADGGSSTADGPEEMVRLRAALREGLTHPALRPDQLDMAPAKGAHVNSLRIKGRLCQRNVLMPEGPKYDSKGKPYLKAYSPGSTRRARGAWQARRLPRDYARTALPRMILPRCCNCCRKSVLGCE